MLTSLQNPLIKRMRKLRQAKERVAQQRFLLEGTHLLQEAIATHYPLDVVCCTPDWQQRHGDLWTLLLEQAQRAEIVSPEVLTALATTVNPDGIVATAIRGGRAQVASTNFTLGLALEAIQDPGNLGTIIRTATAAQADGLWLSRNSVDPENPKVLRASVGQWFRLPVQVVDDLPAQVSEWRQGGWQVIATAASAEQTYWEIDFCQPTLILLGNEGQGLSPALVSLATHQVKIPMQLGVESLNVGISAALMLYEAQRQRRLA